MCGIAGFVSPPGKRADPEILARMVTALRHRGPDAVGYHVDGRVALGVARLRVIELDTGDRRTACGEGPVPVARNGEFYDFAVRRAELEAGGHRFRSRSDTGVVAPGWGEGGPAAVERLNGMFALAVWDARREQLV